MIKALTLFLLFSFSSITLADSSKSSRAHLYDKPYECLFTKISKRSGKKYTNLFYYYPEKNWKIKLLKVNNIGIVKVAMFDTSEGRYAGIYDGVYPEIKKIDFHTFWPNQKRIANNRYSKLNKDDCQLMKDLSIFKLPADTDSLTCMDIKKTGICKALK